MLFRRITSIENFAFHKNRDIPILARLGDYISLMQGANSIFKNYYTAWSGKSVNLNTEVATMLAFTLHTSALGVELADEFLPTVPKDDRYGERMKGLKQMHNGVIQIFIGSVMTLTENNGFSQDDSSFVLAAMAATLPRIKKMFSQDICAEIKSKLEADKLKFTKTQDLLRIERMLISLRN